jgi:hypothetical protein
MPRCYLLAVCSGSSLDERTNNFSLFNLVEQVNFRTGATADLTLPLEVHVYWSFVPDEFGQAYEARWVVSTSNEAETIGQAHALHSISPHFRMRMLGLGVPPVAGNCEVRVEWRIAASDGWTRDPAAWPLTLVSV